MSLQGPGSQNSPENAADLGAVIRKMNERLEKLERGSMLKPAGISVAPEGMTIDSSLTVNGDLTTSGDTVIGGNAAITGTLSLPAGIIDNDALTSPSEFDTGYQNTGALNLTSVEQTFASFTLPIPAGYTRGMVVVNGSVGVINPTGATSSVACRVYVQPTGQAATWGPRRYQSALAGFDAAVYSQLFEEFTGLSGGVFTFWLVILNTGPNWGATAGGGTIDAQVTFLR